MTDTPFFDAFLARLSGADRIERLQAGLIGDGAMIDGPFGSHPLVYADYIASGRALRQIEELMLTEVLPYYANSHTEGSYCGAHTTDLRRQARALIARHCGADDRHATIFAGSGATAGLNRAVHLLGVPQAVAEGRDPLVIVGPYEHHSNLLPWREAGAEVIEIDETATGGPDLEQLEALLQRSEGRPVIGAFSAASNISGILTDTVAVTRILKRYGALAVWDYAGGGPYVSIDMGAATDHEKDVIVLSPHKFIGGPGASGVLIIRKAAVMCARPVWPGGGTVRFVSPWGHDYVEAIEEREEAGTPNILGDIRAALVFVVKAAMGQDWLDQRHCAQRSRALGVWSRLSGLHFAGEGRSQPALPFFSLWLGGAGGNSPLPYPVMTRALSDCFGIQARGGCACAGPYGHRLFNIGQDQSARIRGAILAGNDTDKPGFTRLNLSALMSDAKVDMIIEAVSALASEPDRFAALYEFDPASGKIGFARAA